MFNSNKNESKKYDCLRRKSKTNKISRKFAFSTPSFYQVKNEFHIFGKVSFIPSLTKIILWNQISFEMQKMVKFSPEMSDSLFGSLSCSS